MSQPTPTNPDIQTSLLHALQQVILTQDTHTKLLQQVVEVLTTEPGPNLVVEAIHELSKNVKAQTGAIEAQSMELGALRRSLNKITTELDRVESGALPQSPTPR